MYLVGLLCIIVTTSQWTDSASVYLSDLNDVNQYTYNVQLLRNMMTQDGLWLPILKENVKMNSLPRRQMDHFIEEPPTNTGTEMTVIKPLTEIVELFETQTMIGTEVNFVMEVIRRAMICSTTKYVSMQGLLLHQLILVDEKSDSLPYMVNWLEHMTRISIDKLLAVNQKFPLMAEMYSHIRNLSKKDVDLTTNQLNKISQDMLREKSKVCEKTEGDGPYKTLIKELKKSMTYGELKNLELLMIDENMKGLSEFNDIIEIQKYHGSLTIDENIDPTEFSSLTKEELKKILTVNRIKMNHLYLNLPIKSLAVSQLKNIFNFHEALVYSEEDSQKPNNNNK